MSSNYNLFSVSRTLANQIWNCIRGDNHLRTIITSERQIIHQHQPNQNNTAHILVNLYNVTEMANMHNPQQHPQNSATPRTLLYLKLRYLITPLTLNAENDQAILGKIMQLFAEKPILRQTDLQNNFGENGEALKIVLDDMAADDLGKLWSTLMSPHKLSVSYSVFPVRIEASTEKEASVVLLKTGLTGEARGDKPPSSQNLTSHRSIFQPK